MLRYVAFKVKYIPVVSAVYVHQLEGVTMQHTAEFDRSTFEIIEYSILSISHHQSLSIVLDIF